MNEPISTRDLLVEIGRKQFARNGFSGTSVRSIIAEAGANLGAVTYHFGSKEGLYEAVLHSFIDPMRERFDAAVSEPGPVLDRIEAGVHALADHFNANPDNAPLIMQELLRGEPLPDVVRSWVMHALHTFGALVSRGQDDGTIADGAPALVAASLIAQPFFFAATSRTRDATPGIGENFPGNADIANHICSFIRRSLAAPGRTS